MFNGIIFNTGKVKNIKRKKQYLCWNSNKS